MAATHAEQPGLARARQPAARWDAASALSLLLWLLVAIPSRLVYKPLGAVGTPAQLLALLAFLWWANARLVPSLGVAGGTQPVRTATLLLGGAALASYAAGFTRVIEPAEIRGADRGMLQLAAAAGACLLAADGIGRLDRLERLLGRLVAAASVLAAVGILQFFTGIDLARYFHIPGLTVNHPLALIDARSSFRRVAGTATHPIEFGVVLSLALPVALHDAAERGRRAGAWRWLAVALIALGIPMSLSRSAVVSLLVGMALLLAGWPARRRLATLLVAPVALVAMRLAVPGLLGTIRSLFLDLRVDPSFQGRTQDYAVVAKFIAGAPLFGRGIGTFDPARYVLLDNQYLGSLIETGVVGLAALLGLFATGIACALAARRRLEGARERDLALALAASLLGAMVSFATFDALAFPMATSVVFLLLGCSGALWRLARGDHP